MFWRCVVLLSLAIASSGQVRSSFEVASVKAIASGGIGSGSLRGGPGSNSPGQLSGSATLKTLLMRAYGLKDFQIAGPAWLDQDRYEIAAKVAVGATSGDVALMLQSLLAERFRLEAHRETKELPGYALVIGKTGSKLQESAVAHVDASGALVPPPRLVRGLDGFPQITAGTELRRSYQVVVGGSDGILYKVWARHETMLELAERLSGQLRLVVLDRTGLKGRYDFQLSWTMDAVGGIIPKTYPPPDQIESHNVSVLTEPALSLFSAVQLQLGLRLEPQRGPVEILIVDRADKTPSGN